MKATGYDAPVTVVLYTRPGVLKGWVSVGFADGHVVRLRADDLPADAKTKGWRIPGTASNAQGDR